MKRGDVIFSRIAARIDAQDKLLEMAALKPATVAGVLVQNPELFRELDDDLAKAIVLSLIDRGQAGTLGRLLATKSPQVGLTPILLRNALGE